MAVNHFQAGLTSVERAWLRHVLEADQNDSTGVEVDDGRRLRLLDAAARDVLEAIHKKESVQQAYGDLEMLERIGGEVMRVAVRSPEEPSDLLRRIARDFDRGDEDGEFAEIFADIKRGAYVPRVS